MLDEIRWWKEKSYIQCYIHSWTTTFLTDNTHTQCHCHINSYITKSRTTLYRVDLPAIKSPSITSSNIKVSSKVLRDNMTCAVPIKQKSTLQGRQKQWYKGRDTGLCDTSAIIHSESCARSLTVNTQSHDTTTENVWWAGQMSADMLWQRKQTTGCPKCNCKSCNGRWITKMF